MSYLKQIYEAVAYLQQKYDKPITTGIVLGTGLGGLAKEIIAEKIIDYSEIPHFPLSTVEGHKGKLIIGKLGNQTVLVMQGRFHYYEGYLMRQVAFPIYVMQKLGIKQVFLSNAAGGLNPTFQIGDLMLINDHISMFLPDNPLRGENFEELGVRFPDMTEAYSQKLIAKALEIGQQEHLGLRQGIYVSIAGPMLETKAEYRLLQNLGADTVGMSTIPEVIAAKHGGLEVFAVSVVTDLCYEPYIKQVTLEDFIFAAKKAEPKLKKLFIEMLR
jgi:purine-nucleoside phosphorylase